jgi:hypothetical protein
VLVAANELPPWALQRALAQIRKNKIRQVQGVCKAGKTGRRSSDGVKIENFLFFLFLPTQEIFAAEKFLKCSSVVPIFTRI